MGKDSPEINVEQEESEAGQEDGQKESEPRKPGRLEWVVAGISLLLVILLVGYLFFEALTRSSLPPLVTIQVEQILPVGDVYLVELKLRNAGGQTAANLMVEGSLMQDDVAVETSTATIDFVPAETERRGGLFFSTDPRQFELVLRPLGYDLP